MTLVATCVRDWVAGCRFPARLRLFATEDYQGVVAEPCWRDADTATRIAAAVGCALAAPEATVVVVFAADECAQPAVITALALAATVAAPLRCLVTGDPCAPPPGWATEIGPCWMPVAALTADALDGIDGLTTDAATPVHLPALREWALSADDLACLHRAAPRVLVVDDDQRWTRAQRTPALVVALAAAAREGLRPVLTLDGAKLGDWWGTLAELGRRSTPLCLRVRGTAPPLGWWRALHGWWVCAPGRGEERAVLARALGSRDHVAILVSDERLDGVDPEGHEPGGGRWWHAASQAGVVLAGPGSAGPVIAQARAALNTIGLATAAWESTSVHPLALPHDDRPLVAVEGELQGYAEAVRATRAGVVVTVPVGATAAEVAAAVRRV